MLSWPLGGIGKVLVKWCNVGGFGGPCQLQVLPRESSKRPGNHRNYPASDCQWGCEFQRINDTPFWDCIYVDDPYNLFLRVWPSSHYGGPVPRVVPASRLPQLGHPSRLPSFTTEERLRNNDDFLLSSSPRRFGLRARQLSGSFLSGSCAVQHDQTHLMAPQPRSLMLAISGCQGNFANPAI